MRCESNSNSIFRPFGLPHCSRSLAARGRPPGGAPGHSIAPLQRRTRPPASLAASAVLVLVLLVMITAGRLDSPVRVLPAGRTLAPEVNRQACIPLKAPAPGCDAEGFLLHYCLSPGRGGARPEGCGERGILAYPPARRKGGGVGLPATSQRSRTGRSGPSDRRERVTERHHCPVNSKEHGAKHDATSGMEQLPARSGTTKPGASSGI